MKGTPETISVLSCSTISEPRLLVTWTKLRSSGAAVQEPPGQGDESGLVFELGGNQDGHQLPRPAGVTEDEVTEVPLSRRRLEALEPVLAGEFEDDREDPSDQGTEDRAFGDRQGPAVGLSAST